MSKERRDWILSYKFADFYQTEEAWQKDFKLFKECLKIFDSSQK